MTKKDYELIASAIYSALLDGGDPQELREVASHLANKLSTQDNNFKRVMFLQACGVLG
jgi:hypothetical protein